MKRQTVQDTIEYIKVEFSGSTDVQSSFIVQLGTEWSRSK